LLDTLIKVIWIVDNLILYVGQKIKLI
jgi:hypothetical protein